MSQCRRFTGRHRRTKGISTKGYVMKRSTILVLLAAIALAGCAPKPEAVVQKLTQAVNARDVEAALNLFAADAIVNTGGPITYTGTVEIRSWLEELASANFEIEAEIVEVNGDKVVERETLAMDAWEAIGLRSVDGVSEITVREGLIQSLEFTFTEQSLSDLQTATLKATQPTHSNIPYVEGGRPEQMLDIYIPSEGDPPFPVILIIHGGDDTKEQHNGMAGYFNQAGFAAISIDYGDARQSNADGLCALAWTLGNAGQYGLDPDRVTVFGFSIGGMLASAMGTLDDRATELQDCGNELPASGGMLGIAAYEGIFVTPEGCLSASWCLTGASTDLGIPVVELLPIFETLRDTPPQAWREAETVGVEAAAVARLWPLSWLDGNEPPFLIIHGSGDWIPRIESEAFASRLEDAGVDVELVLLPTASHQSVYPSSSSFADIAGAIVEFARKLGDS